VHENQIPNAYKYQPQDRWQPLVASMRQLETILLDRGYETVVCGLQTAKHGGIIFNYLSFEYLLVLISLL
jgi:hypothetical protein